MTPARPPAPRCSRCRSGSTTEELAVLLVGSTGYVRGNVAALEKVLGLTAAQSNAYANKWLSLPDQQRLPCRSS